MREEPDIKTFRKTHNGFQITFKNGYTISTQFGYMNYCSNKNNKEADPENMVKYEILESMDAEIAIIHPEGGFATGQATDEIYPNEYADDVEANVEIDKWLLYFNWAKERI